LPRTREYSTIDPVCGSIRLPCEAIADAKISELGSLEMSSMLGFLIGGSGKDFPAMYASEAANRFRPRADGGFDYFPEGVRKPGCCVDPDTRDRIMRLERGLDGLFMGLSAILALIVLTAGSLLGHVLPFARAWLTLGLAVIR
jgi:hypothetical protein